MDRLSRRRVVRGGLALVGLGPLPACGALPPRVPRASKVPRVGFLWAGSASAPEPGSEALRAGLRDLGYVDGQNVVAEWRFSESSPPKARALAAELVGLPVDVIVSGGLVEALAAKGASSTIPIVFTIGDPVAAGLVSNIAHPEGNVTGLSSVPSQTIAKRLQLLKEAVPGIRRAAVLWNPSHPAKPAELNEARRAAPALGIELLPAEARTDADLDGAFEAITASAPDALVVLGDPLMAVHTARIAAFAVQQRLPSIFEVPESTGAGGLMNYGASRAALFHRAATYVDRLLKGATPADLPVEQPTAFDFVINLRTARALGLTIPPSVVNQATAVIE